MLEYLKKAPFKAGVILLVLIIILGGGGYLYFSWDNPLDEELDIPTPTELVMLSPPTAKTINTPQPELPDSPTLTPTIEPVCDGPLTMTILLSGVASENYLYGLADSIRVVRVDFQSQKITISFDSVAYNRNIY